MFKLLRYLAIHTPTKSSRTVVIFIKKIWQWLRNLLASSFGSINSKKGHVRGFWVCQNLNYIIRNNNITLVCMPLGSENNVNLSGLTLDIIAVRYLEVLEIFINLHACENYKSLAIINLSQLCSICEINNNIYNKNIQTANYYRLENTIKELKRLAQDRNINIYLFEQKNIMNYKNSALFERLFVNNIN
jgi:hypothetical protein